MQIIDADAHVEESVATWQFLEPRFYPRRPIPVTLPGDTSWGKFNAVWLIDRKVRQSAANPTTMELAQRKRISLPSQELTSVTARLEDLDRFGIDKQVIYPSAWLGCLAEDVELEAALASSYNKFMSTQCNQSGGRLSYAAVLPFRCPQSAVEEIRNVGMLGGAVSIFVRGMEWDMPVNHPSFWPIYEEAERQDLAVAVHIGFGSPTISRMFEGMPSLPEERPFIPPRGRLLVSGLLIQYAFNAIISAGLMEEFPKLRWVFLEAGSEWLVPAVRAITRSGKRDIRKHFDEGRLFASCEPDENLPYLANEFGSDWLVVASDLPHADDFHHDRPEEVFRERGDLSDSLLKKILCDNARRLYGL
ncbi:MAG: amidohydrolase family protein [Deltaproteobacteria bacterium]|nr:amidohydrolase family protein [Deltaproteobacteria bacterium]